LNFLAWLLDSSIPIPGTRLTIGLDALIGLFPFIGDLAGVLASSYILAEANRMGVGRAVLARMAFNVAVEGVIGIVPLLGDVFDAAWKANQKNVRLLTIEAARKLNALDMKRVGGGLLVQTPDDFDVAELRVVTKRQPTDAQMNDLIFAFRVAKFVKSNAIVFCANGMTLGVGAGQMSRVDSTRIAAIKAKNAGLSLKGSVAASDAFFPFRDGLDVVANAGARAVIQPGGSVRDDEVIAAANEHGMAMVFTGMRHFRH